MTVRHKENNVNMICDNDLRWPSFFDLMLLLELAIDGLFVKLHV